MLKDSPAYSSYSVDNLAKAKDFYKTTLGLQVEGTSVPMPMLRLQLANRGSVLIYPKDDHQAASFTVLNFPVDDVEKTVGELTARGVEFEHYDDEAMMATDDKGISRGGGVTIAWFKDPAGNVMAILEK